MDSRDENLRVISFVSGFTASVFRTIVGHPFDTIKVLTQTEGNKYVRKPFSSVRNLYRGIWPPLCTSGILTSINFTVYENVRLSALHRLNPDPKDFVTNCSVVFASGVISGSTVMFLVSPVDNVKIVQQTTKKQLPMYMWFKKIAYEGNLYRAFFPQWVCQSIGRGFYLGANFATKFAIEKYYPEKADTLGSKLAAASSAGLSGWFFTYPMDVVRNNMMADWKKANYKFKSTLECIKFLYKHNGFLGFYKGFGYVLVRAVPVACITLPIYDYTMTFLLEMSSRS